MRALSDGVGAGIFGGGRSRVGGGLGRRRRGGSEASVKGVERVEPPQPGKEGGHLLLYAQWHGWRGRERGRELKVGRKEAGRTAVVSQGVVN